MIAELQKGQGKWSRPKLSRIENREQVARPREVEQLLDVYRVKDKRVRQWLIELASRVMARMTRRQVLSRAASPKLHVILDAGVLERPIGEPAVMRKQFRHLAEATESSHITIQVLPKSVGASPALEGPFSILTLPEPIPDIGFTESPSHLAYIEDRDEVRNYALRFGILTEQSLPQAKSVKLITEAAKGYD